MINDNGNSDNEPILTPAELLAAVNGESELEAPPAFPKIRNFRHFGWIGEFALGAARKTEADPAAILLTLLVAVGAILGNCICTMVGDVQHFARLYVLKIGKSSRARKGTASAPVRRLLKHFAQQFQGISTLRISDGPLSSGEGVVYAIRDPAQGPCEGKNQVPDPGVADKRMLLFESEFGAVLRAFQRIGNILSAILRAGWDHGCIEPLTKKDRIKATNAHLCISADITKEEFDKERAECDLHNGLLNRFLIAAVRRSKIVALPEGLRDDQLKYFCNKLKTAVETAEYIASKGGVVALSGRARHWWLRIYPHLTKERTGPYGAVTDRAEAQAIRLALIFAVADASTTIERKHLLAALTVWRFCDESARYIFGEQPADRYSQQIVEALARKPMTQTELFSGVFGRNVPAAVIGNRVAELEARGVLERSKHKTNGRPVTTFHLKQPPLARNGVQQTH